MYDVHREVAHLPDPSTAVPAAESRTFANVVLVDRDGRILLQERDHRRSHGTWHVNQLLGAATDLTDADIDPPIYTRLTQQEERA